jgi:hypothetical protein
MELSLPQTRKTAPTQFTKALVLPMPTGDLAPIARRRAAFRRGNVEGAMSGLPKDPESAELHYPAAPRDGTPLLCIPRETSSTPFYANVQKNRQGRQVFAKELK